MFGVNFPFGFGVKKVSEKIKAKNNQNIKIAKPSRTLWDISEIGASKQLQI